MTDFINEIKRIYQKMENDIHCGIPENSATISYKNKSLRFIKPLYFNLYYDNFHKTKNFCFHSQKSYLEQKPYFRRFITNSEYSRILSDKFLNYKDYSFSKVILKILNENKQYKNSFELNSDKSISVGNLNKKVGLYYRVKNYENNFFASNKFGLILTDSHNDKDTFKKYFFGMEINDHFEAMDFFNKQIGLFNIYQTLNLNKAKYLENENFYSPFCYFYNKRKFNSFLGSHNFTYGIGGTVLAQDFKNFKLSAVFFDNVEEKYDFYAKLKYKKLHIGKVNETLENLIRNTESLENLTKFCDFGRNLVILKTIFNYKFNKILSLNGKGKFYPNEFPYFGLGMKFNAMDEENKNIIYSIFTDSKYTLKGDMNLTLGEKYNVIFGLDLVESIPYPYLNLIINND